MMAPAGKQNNTGRGFPSWHMACLTILLLQQMKLVPEFGCRVEGCLASPQRDLSSTSLPEVSLLGRIMDHSYKTDFSSFEPESLFATELWHHDLNYPFLLRHIQSLYFHRIIFETKLPEFRKPLNNEIAIISMPDTVLVSSHVLLTTAWRRHCCHLFAGWHDWFSEPLGNGLDVTCS